MGVAFIYESRNFDEIGFRQKRNFGKYNHFFKKKNLFFCFGIYNFSNACDFQMQQGTNELLKYGLLTKRIMS